MQPEQVDDLAREVVSRLEPGLLVRLSGASLKSGLPADSDLQVTAAIRLEVSWKVAGSADKGGLYLLTSRYIVKALPVDSDSVVIEDDEPAWECVVELQGQWEVEDAAGLTEDHLRAFAARVGIMALHPYARSNIQMLVSESGWPPYTLDVLTGQDELFADAEVDGELDLSGISVEIKA